jgi:hypothetical protein
MKLHPWLLLHPNIPMPLHGLAPRIILGDSWWQQQKKLAKEKSDNRCLACGVTPKQAKYHQWLETHEVYNMYSNGTIEFKTCVALCHSCHNFIHDGRMQALTEKKEYPKEKYLDILDHGNQLLSNWWGKEIVFKNEAISFLPDDKIYQNLPLKWERFNCKWTDYHLVLYGQRYESKFPSHEAWLQHYQ